MHIPEDPPDGRMPLQETLIELQCIGRRVLAIMPTTDENGKFNCKVYEQDETHVTRLTREGWYGFSPDGTVLELDDLTRQIRPSTRQANGTVSLLMTASDERRQSNMDWRLQRRTTFLRVLFGRQPRKFNLTLESLLPPGALGDEDSLGQPL